ncbi:hypothetical protein [Thalassospira sp.]|uniref:hypothetical protein n=1 Tax=Thalassospira sp. TaxID=1912094 RepID=UPI002737665F|nr:hypothetical protein [Thalassospira sp.]MDP2698783.1 hypothetical protein [Thalassospira sp.]
MGFWSLGGLRQPKAQDIKWRKSPRGDYYKLFMLDDIADLKLDGVGGVYLIWHGGLKPGWLTAGATDDLGESFRDARSNREIRNYDGRGGVFISWSPIVDDYRDGVVHFIEKHTNPAFDCDYDKREEPIPVLLPR